jgi:hypothetical protein
VGYLSFDKGEMAPFNPVNVDAIDKKPDGVTEVLGPPGTPSHVDPPYPMYAVFKLQSWALRDANWSPDFPTAARQAEDLLDREAHKKVDGVIAIDPYFIQGLLAVTGPVKVALTGDTVNKDNFFRITLERRELGAGATRNEFLPSASKQIVAKLMSLPSSQWHSLLDALHQGCDSRSLQIYFHSETAQALSKRHNCTGQVQLPPHDSLMVVETNVGGNKDDFWMKRKHSIQIDIRKDGSSRHTLKLHYYGLSSQGYAFTRNWGYTGWLRVYLPPSTSLVSVSGAFADPKEPPKMDLGHMMWQGWFYVQFDHTVDVTVIYDEDPIVTGAKKHQLEFLWQKQGGRLADPITVGVSVPSGWKINKRTMGDRSISGDPISSDLSVDRLFTFQYEGS